MIDERGNNTQTDKKAQSDYGSIFNEICFHSPWFYILPFCLISLLDGLQDIHCASSYLIRKRGAFPVPLSELMLLYL